MYYMTTDGFNGTLTVNIDTVLLVSPGNSTFQDSASFLRSETASNNMGFALRLNGENLALTISGNFPGSKKNISYSASNVNTQNTAIKYTGSGTLNFSAQSGAYDSNPNSFSDSLIKISASSRSTIANGTTGASGNRNLSVCCIQASDLTISSDMSASLTSTGVMSSGDYQDSKGNWYSSASGNTGVIVGYRVNNLSINYNFTGEIIVNNQFTVSTSHTNSVSGNTLSSIGILSTGAVNVSGNLGGIIAFGVTGNVASNPDPEKDKYAVNITSNTFTSVAIQSQSLTINQDFTATWISSLNNLTFSATSTPAISAAFNNNTLKSSGYIGGNLSINGRLNGSITASIDNLVIGVNGYPTPDTQNVYQDITNNDISLTGISLTGNLVVGNNVGLDINLSGSQNQLDLNINPGPVPYPYNNTYELYGITAKNITVSGQFSSGSSITMDSSMNTYANGSLYTSGIFTFATRSFGIHAEKLTAQNYAGTINVSSNGYSCGIYMENTLISSNGNEPFTFNGDITVSSLSYFGIASGMMGFYDGYNLRVSGNITATGSYYSDAITSGTYSIIGDDSYNYSYSVVDDYVEFSASANIEGNVNLSAGINTFVINDNANILGSLGSKGGLSNVQFNLEGTANSNTTVITTNIYDYDAFAVSTTKITFNLNDALAGENYYVIDSANVDLSLWQIREFTLTFQGVSQRVAFGQTFDFSTVSGYNVNATVLFDDTKGLYVSVTQQDSGYVLNSVTVTVDATAARAVNLSWNSVTGADYYIVEYADNASFDKSIVKLVSGNSINLTQLDNSIYYRVRAASGRGQIGDWTSGSATPGSVVPDVPLTPSSMIFINPDKPTQGINTAAVRFDWQDQNNIQNYTLEYIITSEKIILPAGSSPEDYWNAALLTGTQYSRSTNASEFLLTGLPEQSMVYWRVCATSNSGETGSWNYGDEFQSWTADKTAPQTGKGFTITAKTTYDSNTNYETLKFTWGDIIDTQSGISSYIIVCTGANGYTKTYTIRETDPAKPAVNSLTVGDFVNANLGNSLRDGTYSYTFQAIDWVGNRTNLISGSNSFTVTPTISTPKATLTTNNNGTDATFTWRMSGDVVGYTLQYVLGNSDDFSSANTVTLSFSDMSAWAGGNPTTTVNNLAATTDNTSYFWHVQATYSDGTTSAWEDGNSFYFDNTAPDAVTDTYAIVDIKYNTTSSTNNWGSTTTSSVKTSVNAYLSWDAVTDDRGSVTYKVEVADNEYFNNSKSFSTTNAYLNFGDGTNGTVGAGYLSGMQNVYWRVYAVDDNGNTSDPTNGTYYQVVNPYVGSVTLAPYFKWADVDNTAPTKVTIASQTYSSDDQYFNWSTSTSLEGVAGYNVVFTDKQGNVMYQTYTTSTNIVFDSTSGLADGNYKLSVQAVGCSGKTSTASTKSVYIDFNGPTPVGNVSSTVFNTDASLTWTAATDIFGIAAYQVRYTSGNDINSSAITTMTGDQLKLTNLANGNYTYQVRGVDKNGNLGQWTTGNFTIDTAGTAGQTFATAKAMNWAQSSNQSFGGSWPANYFKYTATDTGVFTFTIDNMAYGNGKFSVYDSNYKLIKTYNVSQGGSYAYLFNLTAGAYYVSMGSATKYNYGSYTINSNNEYGVSDWSYDTKNSGGENYITGSVSDGVLGYGTPSNTFTFNLLYNGEIDLTVNNVTGGTVSLTIYQTVNGVDKKLKTLSVSPKNISGALKGLDLYAGDYKIVLSNSQAAQNVTAEYDLSIDGAYFPADTESLVMVDQGNGTVKGTVTDAFVGFGDPNDSFTFTAASQAEYNFALSDLSANATLTIYQTVNGKLVKLTTVNAGASANGYFDTLLNSGDYTVVVNNPTPTKTNTLFDLTVQSENNQITFTGNDGNANGWLNAANSADYYDFTMNAAGKITLSLDNVTASTKLSIIDSNNKVVATISTSSLISKDFNLAAGDYWLKVESTKTTAYDFNVLVA